MSTTSSHAVFSNVRCCFVGWDDGYGLGWGDLRGKRTTYDSDCQSVGPKAAD